VVCWAGDHTAVDAIAAGLEAFYERFGWTVVGTWPSALQIAPGDRRDEVLVDLGLGAGGVSATGP
jgi:hypothetical protein